VYANQEVGEIFLCNKETHGRLTVLENFLGRAITSLGGGCEKLYVIEKGQGFEGKMVPIHGQEEFR
jgi:hypothetical protein